MSEVDQHLLRMSNVVNGYNTVKDSMDNTEEKTTEEINARVAYYKNFILS